MNGHRIPSDYRYRFGASLRRDDNWLMPCGHEFLGNVEHTIDHAVGGWQKGLGYENNAHSFKIRTRFQLRASEKQRIDEQLAEIWCASTFRSTGRVRGIGRPVGVPRATGLAQDRLCLGAHSRHDRPTAG